MRHTLDWKQVYQWQLQHKEKYGFHYKWDRKLWAVIHTIKTWIRWHLRYKKWLAIFEKDRNNDGAKYLIIYRYKQEDQYKIDWDKMRDRRYIIK